MYYASKNEDVYQIGKWKRGEGLFVNKNSTTQSDNENKGDKAWDKNEMNSLDMIFQNDSVDPVTLVVVTKEERPYVMLREDKTGNEAFDGFCIDLLKVIVYMSILACLEIWYYVFTNLILQNSFLSAKVILI